MQAGDRHQMIGARLLQLLPLADADGTPIPDHQGQQDALDGRIRQRGIHLYPHCLAKSLQWIVPARGQAPVLICLAHIARGADPVLIQPGFVIESTGIAKSVWTFETHAQAPGFPSAKDCIGTIPAESNATRRSHRRLPGPDPSDIKFKANMMLIYFW